MALCGDAKVLFCLVFIVCCTLTVAQMPMDCCLNVSNNKIHRKLVRGYKQQIRGQGCYIDAVIFMTKGGRNLCAPADEMWVKALMKYVNRCQKVNFKGKRCGAATAKA